MRVSLDRYEQLLAEELAGIISPEDQAVLDKAKAEIPEVKQLWEERQAIFNQEEFNAWLNAEMIPPPLSKKRVFKKRARIVIAVLFVAAALVGLYILDHSNQKVKFPSTVVVLELEKSGQLIDLSCEGKIFANKVHFNNENRSLTYVIDKPTTEWATITAPAGKDYSTTLSDGTKVKMDALSTLRFPLSFNHFSSRQVYITGQVYFKVAKDRKHPFIVNLPTGTIQVTGTEFNVNTYEKGKPQVGLVEGEVIFRAGKAATIMKPGTLATFANDSIHTAPLDEDLLCWLTGLYKFNDMKVEDVMRIIPRWFGQEVVLDNPKYGKERITGVLDRNESVNFNVGLLIPFKGKGFYTDENNVIHIR